MVNSGGVCVTITLLALCVMGLIASRNIPSIDDPAAAAKGKRAGMLFGIIFGLEGGLIALARRCWRAFETAELISRNLPR